MSVRPIIRFGDPRLLLQSTPVELRGVGMMPNLPAAASIPALALRVFIPTVVRELVADLRATMAAANGAGIAAPQIGVTSQVVLFGTGKRNPRYPDAELVPATALINPRWVPLTRSEFLALQDAAAAVPTPAAASTVGGEGVMENNHAASRSVAENTDGAAKSGLEREIATVAVDKDSSISTTFAATVEAQAAMAVLPELCAMLDAVLVHPHSASAIRDGGEGDLGSSPSFTALDAEFTRRAALLKQLAAEEAGGSNQTPICLTHAHVTVSANASADSVMQSGFEGCLSVPGLRGSVERYRYALYQGICADTGHVVRRWCRDFHARVFQHEVDHLAGYLFPMRVTRWDLFGFTEELVERGLVPPLAPSTAASHSTKPS